MQALHINSKTGAKQYNTSSFQLCCAVKESMALEASARVAVTNAIENKEDLGRMLGTYILTTCKACLPFCTHIQGSPIVLACIA